MTSPRNIPRMRGLYDDLAELADRLKAGTSGPDEAMTLLARAEDRLSGLRERSRRGPAAAAGYEDEIHEIEEQAKRVKAAMLARPDAPYICIFRRPERFVEVEDERTGQMIQARLPFLAVLRAGDMDWLQRDGRQRVRDLWELLVDGVPCRPPVIGPRRWVMQNAQGAAQMDAAGLGTWWMTRPTALQRRRALYITQKANRRIDRRGNRRSRKRHWLAIRRVGAVIAEQILKRVFRDPIDYRRFFFQAPISLASPPTSTPR